MSEEAAGRFCIHSTTLCITVILFLTYASDFRITCLRVHEYKSAYAGFRYHGVTFCQFYAEWVFVSAPIIMLVLMPTAAACASVAMTMGVFVSV